MKPKYLTINELVNFIDEPNRAICRKFLEDNAEILKDAYGSKNNHQAWPGGYLDHVRETMNFGVHLYSMIDEFSEIDESRKNTFSLSDVLLVLFLHDIEKPWKYIFQEGKIDLKPEMTDRKYVKRFASNIISNYGFVLNEDILNGLEYVEGEMDAYSPGKRAALPIAAFCHMCDFWIARGWYDHPKRRVV